MDAWSTTRWATTTITAPRPAATHDLLYIEVEETRLGKVSAHVALEPPRGGTPVEFWVAPPQGGRVNLRVWTYLLGTTAYRPNMPRSMRRVKTVRAKQSGSDSAFAYAEFSAPKGSVIVARTRPSSPDRYRGVSCPVISPIGRSKNDFP